MLALTPTIINPSAATFPAYANDTEDRFENQIALTIADNPHTFAWVIQIGAVQLIPCETNVLINIEYDLFDKVGFSFSLMTGVERDTLLGYGNIGPFDLISTICEATGAKTWETVPGSYMQLVFQQSWLQPKMYCCIGILFNGDFNKMLNFTEFQNGGGIVGMPEQNVWVG